MTQTYTPPAPATGASALTIGLTVWAGTIATLAARYSAFPAGIGDAAVGFAAIFVTIAVARKTEGWQRSARWLAIAGIADFVVAFATAILSEPGRPLSFEGAPPPDAMQSLPVVMIPAFGVPLFLILHMMVLIRLRTEG